MKNASMENTLAPIVLFVYNRPKHTLKTVEALMANRLASLSDLIVYSDGSRGESDDASVELTRRIFEQTLPFKSVTLHKAPKNRGLANSIIDGVSEVLTKYETAIVLEDDLVTSPGFLEYMNSALGFYKDSSVYSISGYTPPIKIPATYKQSTYASGRICSWGWGTWRSKWQEVKWTIDDFDTFYRDSQKVRSFNKMGNDISPMLYKYEQRIINSWAVRFAYHTFKANGVAIYPTKSLVSNRGIDGSGTHMRATNKYQVELVSSIDSTLFCSAHTTNSEIMEAFRRFYNTSLFRLLINTLKRFCYLVRKS